jgi:hypothetical protein
MQFHYLCFANSLLQLYVFVNKIFNSKIDNANLGYAPSGNFSVLHQTKAGLPKNGATRDDPPRARHESSVLWDG